MLTRRQTVKLCQVTAAVFVAGSLLVCGSNAHAANLDVLPEALNEVALRVPVKQFIFYKESVTFKPGQFIPKTRTITYKENHSTYTGVIRATERGGTRADHELVVIYEGTLYLQ